MILKNIIKNDFMKVLITGAKGFIARNLIKYLPYDITSISRDDFDLSDFEKTNIFFKDKYFDVVIHCATSGGSRLRKDEHLVYHNNVSMINNLISNNKHYYKFINFTSGAESNFDENNLYGQSKRYITAKLKYIKNSYNLRIYNCFGTDELETRFIKSNLIRYINRENMIIHQNKKMDFFYVKDLINSVKYIIENDILQKEFDLCYLEKYYLSEIAEIINTLNPNYNVNIITQNSLITKDYIGNNCKLPINWIGIKNGIKEMYEEIKNGK